MCKNETGPLLADPVATVDFFPYETSHAFSIWPAPGQTAPAVQSAHVCLELSPIPLVAGRPFFPPCGWSSACGSGWDDQHRLDCLKYASPSHRSILRMSPFFFRMAEESAWRWALVPPGWSALSADKPDRSSAPPVLPADQSGASRAAPGLSGSQTAAQNQWTVPSLFGLRALPVPFWKCLSHTYRWQPKGTVQGRSPPVLRCRSGHWPQYTVPHVLESIARENARSGYSPFPGGRGPW